MRVQLVLRQEGESRTDREESAFSRLGALVCPTHQRHIDHLAFEIEGAAHVAQAELCCARMAGLVAETLGGNGTVVTFPEPDPAASRRRRA